MNSPASHFDRIIAHSFEEDTLEKPSYEDQATYLALREQDRDQALMDNLTFARIIDHLGSDIPAPRSIRFVNSPQDGIYAHLDCYTPTDNKNSVTGEAYLPIKISIGKYNENKDLVHTRRFDQSDLDILVDYFDGLEQDQLDGLLPDLQTVDGYYGIHNPYDTEIYLAEEQPITDTTKE